DNSHAQFRWFRMPRQHWKNSSLRNPTMLTFSKLRLVAVATALVLGLSTVARGDEIQYFPDNPHVVVFVNVANILKSKTAEAAAKSSASGLDSMAKGMASEFGLSGDNITRMAICIPLDRDPKHSTIVFATAKPVTAAEIKAKLLNQTDPWKE